MNSNTTAVITGLILIIWGQVCSQDEKKIEIRGLYGHPAPLWDQGYRLDELGVNAVFVHSGAINHDLMQRTKEEGVQVYAEFATLNGKEYVNEYPDAHAINEKGKKVEAASWFMGVCPSNAEFRLYRLKELRNLLDQYDVDGIWMDYIHWHAQFEEPEPILPQTCFCEDCLQAFSRYSPVGITGSTTSEKAQWILENADMKWREWRCQVIVDWVKTIREIINELKPNAFLGIYHCPWQDSEFGGARRRILGLDYDLIVEEIDVFSPMVYHSRMGREASWVEENIIWHSQRLEREDGSRPRIWPIVQAYQEEEKMPAEEFETALLGGLAGSSSGVMMFTTRAVARDPNKLRVMKELYQSLIE